MILALLPWSFRVMNWFVARKSVMSVISSGGRAVFLAISVRVCQALSVARNSITWSMASRALLFDMCFC